MAHKYIQRIQHLQTKSVHEWEVEEKLYIVLENLLQIKLKTV